MSLKRLIARNVIWNWSGVIAHMATGFVTFPILVDRLGEGDCGLWMLIISLSMYFELLDLGLRGSISRNIAFYKAKGEFAGVNSVLTTGLGLLLVVSIAVLLATAGVQLIFFQLFEVRPEAVEHARLAIWLIALNLSLLLPISVAESTLWGYQRFDVMNMIDIPSVVLRAALVIFLVTPGSQSLVLLAVIHLTVTVLNGLVVTFCASRLDKRLRLGVKYLRWDAVKHLFDVGIWCFLLGVANIFCGRLGLFLIGNRFSVRMVTSFDAASRMVVYARSLVTHGTGVLTPLTTTWHAQDKQDQQRRLFLFGGKACLALALFFLGGFVFLGHTFLYLWTGRELAFASTILLILMCGELLPMSQWVTFSTVLGMNRHRVWACWSIVEIAMVIGFAVLFLNFHYSATSVALAIAVSGAICRGAAQMVYGCRLMNVSLGEYLLKAQLPAVAATAPAIMFLGALTQWHTPSNWFELFGFAIGYGILFVMLLLFFVTGIRPVLALLHQGFAQPASEPVSEFAETK